MLVDQSDVTRRVPFLALFFSMWRMCMGDLTQFNEKPTAEYMIVGWRQWADAGAVSSDLPQYLIDQLDARKIGEIKPDGFYLFQIPGFHSHLRPTIRLAEGHRQELQETRPSLSATRNRRLHSA